MQIVFALQRFASAAGIGLPRAVQMFLIAVECGLLFATDRLMDRFGVRRRRLLLLAGIALNPICVLLICQHGNFDVLIALAVVLFVSWSSRFLADGREVSWLVASLFLGAGIAVKGAPAVLAPLLCAGVRRVSAAAKGLGALLLLGPAAYGLSIVYVLGPEEIARKVFAYRSIPGWFGVTGLFHWLRRDEWTRTYAGVVFPIALAVALSLLAVSLWRARSVSAREVALWSVVLLVAIPFLGSGYGPQYIYWFWPLLLVVAASGSLPLRVAAAAFAGTAIVTYAIEYALFEVLGSFLLWKAPPSEVASRDCVPLVPRGGAAQCAPLPLLRRCLCGLSQRDQRDSRGISGHGLRLPHSLSALVTDRFQRIG